MTFNVELSEQEKEQLAKAKELGAKDLKLVTDFVDDNKEAVIGVGTAVAITAIVTTVVVCLLKCHDKNKETEKKIKKIKKLSRRQRRKLEREKMDAFLNGEDVVDDVVFEDVEMAETPVEEKAETKGKKA